MPNEPMTMLGEPTTVLGELAMMPGEPTAMPDGPTTEIATPVRPEVLATDKQNNAANRRKI
jgi:hypothetical protein